MTLSRMSQAAKLAERARRCVGYHETWADNARSWLRPEVLWVDRVRVRNTRRAAHRARVALASARYTYLRLATLILEDVDRATL